ncbi:hypothetical protein D1871_11240 [Nakamurella silvestris]|nr:hypothetical protein D1871_11240 [Nakamurella silvestris]
MSATEVTVPGTTSNWQREWNKNTALHAIYGVAALLFIAGLVVIVTAKSTPADPYGYYGANAMEWDAVQASIGGGLAFLAVLFFVGTLFFNAWKHESRHQVCASLAIAVSDGDSDYSTNR